MLFSHTAVLADNIPVSVDRRTVVFYDQEPEIINSRTMIPLRGVFEALGAKVTWDGEERKVTVFSKDNLTRLIFYIDSTTFKQLVFKSLLSFEVTEYESEVAPIIRNGRTMIPLYLVADYMGNKAEWNDIERSVTVTSKERINLLNSITTDGNMTSEDALNTTLPTLSLSCDKTDVNTGDEVSVTLNLSNVDNNGDLYYFGITSSILYNTENFELKSTEFIIDDELSTKVANPDFMSNSVRFVYLHRPSTMPALKNSGLVKLVFVAKNDNGGEFKISDRLLYSDYDTTLITRSEGKDLMLDTADELYIDTAPVVVK